MFKIGDEVVWKRSVSSWSRVTTEAVQAVVEQVYAKRIRIRLRTRILNSLTALVRPERLTPLNQQEPQ